MSRVPHVCKTQPLLHVAVLAFSQSWDGQVAQRSRTTTSGPLKPPPHSHRGFEAEAEKFRSCFSDLLKDLEEKAWGTRAGYSLRVGAFGKQSQSLQSNHGHIRTM